MRVSGIGCRVSGGRQVVSIAALLVVAAPCSAQRGETILLVNRPAGPKESAIDLTDYVARDLSQVPGFTPIIFKPNLQTVKDAVAANQLAQEDAREPLTPESARKVARALGFRQILRLSARSTPNGVAAEAEMERLSGQQAWGVVFTQKLEPYKSRGGKPSLLEGIKAQAAVIVQRVTGAPTQVQTQDPIAIRTDPKDPAKPSKQPDSTVKKDVPPVKPDDPVPTPPSAAPQPAPLAGPSYELLADRYRREGDQANLILALRKAINDKPKESRLRRELIQVYIERGWHSMARDEAARAVSLAPEDAALRRMMGEAYLRSGDLESALRELQEAVRSNPNDVVTLVGIGDVYFGSAKLEDAEKAYSAAVKADPKHPLPHRRLARILVDRAQYPEALKAIAAARGSVKEEEADSLLPDYAGYLSVLESALNEVLARIHFNRQAVRDGSRTREQGFTFGVSQRKRAEDIASFLDTVPPIPSLLHIQRLYAQAAGFVIQAAEAALLTVENQDTRRDEEASLLRLEATRALSDASKRLKAVTTK